MPPDLGQPYLPTWDGAPPHMAPRDLPLWRRYRQSTARFWTAVYFDVALGEGAPLPTNGSRLTLDMWQRITRQRADVVTLSRAGWTIVELRPNAGPSALGTILSYRVLWKADPPDRRPLAILLVTNQTTQDLELAATKLGVPLLMV